MLRRIARRLHELAIDRRNPAVRMALIVRDAIESFVVNADLLRAAALTYTVALAVVPLLALTFAVLKGLGAAAELRPLVARYLALGSPELTEQIMSFVERVDATALGSAGGIFLLVTAISTMTTVEYAFNAIFRAPRGRSYLRRLSDYLGVVVVVPALIAGAVTLSTLVTFRFWEAQFAARLVPYALAWAAFFFLFVFFPYTRVRVVPALIGSFVTAVLFQLAQWGYVYFQIGVTSYQAIYGALASVPIFLVWVYVAWAIVLFGAELTAAIQRGVPQRALHRGESAGFARAAALQVLLRLAEQQDGVDRERRITVETLADDLGVEPRALARVVERLLASGALASGADGALALAAPAESLSVADAMRSLLDAEAGDARDARVAELLERVGRAEREVLRGVTIADLAGSKSRPARDDAED